eukprot:gene19142-9592_t
MVLCVFMLDTSASMNQRAHTGMSYLDTAKHAVDSWMKMRRNRQDRYFLVTYGEGNTAIKVGGHLTPHANFQEELKNLVADDLSRPGQALKTTLDLINLYRMQNGIDNYTQGRNPWYCESVLILSITDGGLTSTATGATDKLEVPMDHSGAGSDLTAEPFRWDQ